MTSSSICRHFPELLLAVGLDELTEDPPESSPVVVVVVRPRFDPLWGSPPPAAELFWAESGDLLELDELFLVLLLLLEALEPGVVPG